MEEENSTSSGENNRNEALTPKLAEKFLETQKQQLLNEATELRIREKEIDINARLGEKSMELQADYLKAKPSENRKTITRFAYIVGGLTLLIFALIFGCLYLNKEDFLITLIEKVGYVVTTGMGYWFGKKSNEPKNKTIDDEIEDANVVE
jgi:hypothetical protein